MVDVRPARVRLSGRRVVGAIVSIALVCGTLVAPPAGTVQAATVTYSGAGDAPRISVIGDSVMAAIRWYGTWSPLRRFNYTVDVESCRRTAIASCRGREGFAPDNTVNAMRRLEGRLGSVLVVGTGYDDPGVTFPGAVDAVMAEAMSQGIPVVVWATMRTQGVRYVGPGGSSNVSTFLANNRTLYAKAAQYGGRLQVADWATYSASRSDWVEWDGIHLTPSGATAMAGFIAGQSDLALQRFSRPRGVTASVAPVGGAGSGQVLLQWSPPPYTGGRVVTDYAIQRSSDGGATWRLTLDGVSRSRSSMLSGLSNGRRYLFRVAAFTSAGWGPYSAPVAAVPRAAKPSPPRSLTASVSPAGGAGSGQVLLQWSLPSYTGGRAVTDYAILRSSDGGATWRHTADGVSPSRSFLATGLSNGRRYLFRVAAFTSAGWSSYSTTVAAVPRAAKPSPPRNVTASVAPAGGAGSGQVLLQWSLPSYTGGRAVTDYAILRSSDGGATWRHTADGVSPSRSFLASGLSNGRSYLFRVAAYTSAGYSSYSTSVLAVPRNPAALAEAAAVTSTTSTSTTPLTTTTVPPTTAPVEAVPETTTSPGASVGDFVWTDGDLDGVQDVGELPLGGVVVRLLDSAGAIVDEDVSDSDGSYQLTSGTAGPAVVEVVVPDGYQPTIVDAGLSDELDSDADPLDVVVAEDETTVRVAAEDAGAGGIDLDLGFVIAPAPPTTSSEPATTEPATTVPATTVPATEPSTTVSATTVPATEPATTTTTAPATTTPPPETSDAPSASTGTPSVPPG